MNLPRVVFLSAPPLGKALLAWVRDQMPFGLGCNVIAHNITAEPASMGVLHGLQYELGLNFMGVAKIPAGEIAKAPWINFHPAPLPEYGGRNVSYHAIMDGAAEYGATVHRMDENFDTGPIIECRRFPILPSDTAGDIFAKAEHLLVEMFKRWVPELLKGRVPSVPQDRSKMRYFKKEPIDEVVLKEGPDKIFFYRDEFSKVIRARTFPQRGRFARLVIGGKRYKIVPEE